MAAMTTVLTEFSTNGDSRTYTAPAHTVLKPVLVLQKRKVPVGSAVVAEDTITVLQATVDSAGAALPQKVSFSVTVRRPITGQDADVTAAETLFREIIASDNFANIVDSQEYVQ